MAHSSAYRIRRCLFTHSHLPGAVFQARLLDNQECTNSANAERYVFGKLSARSFQSLLFRHRHYANYSGHIEHGKSAEGCVMYTVVYRPVLRIHPLPCPSSPSGCLVRSFLKSSGFFDIFPRLRHAFQVPKGFNGTSCRTPRATYTKRDPGIDLKNKKKRVDTIRVGRAS